MNRLLHVDALDRARKFVSQSNLGKCFLEIYPTGENNGGSVLVAVTDFNFFHMGAVLVKNDGSVYWSNPMKKLSKPGHRWGPFCSPSWQTIN